MKIVAHKCPFCKKLWDVKNKELYISHLKRERESIKYKNKIKNLTIKNDSFFDIFKEGYSKTIIEKIFNHDCSVLFFSTYAIPRIKPNVLISKDYYFVWSGDEYFEKHDNKKIKNIVDRISIILRDNKIVIVFWKEDVFFSDGTLKNTQTLKTIKRYSDKHNIEYDFEKSDYPEFYKRIKTEFKLKGIEEFEVKV